MRRKWLTLISIVAVLTASVAAVTIASAGSGSATIDFEGLAEGTIVSSLSSGNGISGDLVTGSVDVFGTRPGFAGNQAMVFDSTCAPGGTGADCSGGDADLLKPVLGNTLIISEDNDSTDPDDADLVGANFEFDFAGFGNGVVTVDSLDVMDVEAVEPGAKIEVYSGGPGGTLEKTVPIPTTGDNGLANVAVNATGDFMRVTLNGSGAIDNIEVTVEEAGIGRVTGGGHQITLDGARITRGFTLHCDITLSNNLEINWPGGNKWHLEKESLIADSIECLDTPEFDPEPPAAPLDTFKADAWGSLNGAPDSFIRFTLIDDGEPGKDVDWAMIKIWNPGEGPGDTAWAPGSGEAPVLDVPLQLITGGNIQMHFDQPHK